MSNEFVREMETEFQATIKNRWNELFGESVKKRNLATILGASFGNGFAFSESHYCNERCVKLGRDGKNYAMWNQNLASKPSGRECVITQGNIDSERYELEEKLVIIDPAYQAVLQVIGRDLLFLAEKYDIHFRDFFPGKTLFDDEFTMDNIQIPVEYNGTHYCDVFFRRFRLDAFSKGGIAATIETTVPHMHHYFGIPIVPTTEIKPPHTLK